MHIEGPSADQAKIGGSGTVMCSVTAATADKSWEMWINNVHYKNTTG